VDSSRETHFDHKWTTDEAANAVLAGSMDLIRAYKKLWAPENLLAAHAACNFGRNKKAVMGASTSLFCHLHAMPPLPATTRRGLPVAVDPRGVSWLKKWRGILMPLDSLYTHRAELEKKSG
jgi:hypothetical protein